jgi:hypothetical protein
MTEAVQRRKEEIKKVKYGWVGQALRRDKKEPGHKVLGR